MTHIPDLELLMDADDELDGARGSEVREHLATCARCDARQRELVRALASAVEAQHLLPVPAGETAREKLRWSLRSSGMQRYLALGALAAAMVLMVFPWVAERNGAAAPRAGLTPGAVRNVSVETMCAMGEATEQEAIPHAVAMEVFRSYGIEDPRPRAYEVDYLIPPDLGGSAAVQNLWPQPYDGGKWNSRVKDALEDRLRTMVCNGSLELPAAQGQIAADWIGAYKKHFRTAEPLPDHVAFVKDRAWE